MYQQHWRFQKKPFEDCLDPAAYVPLHTHQGGLLKLRYLIDEHKGIALVVGEHGVGKSLLTHVLEAESQNTQEGPFVRLLIPQLSPAAMFASWAQRLAASLTGGLEEHLILASLESRLAELSSQGRHPVLIMDDAHQLDFEHLKLLRSLLNLREAGTIRFSVILSGRPELLGLLQMVPGLEQRLVVRASLEALSARETKRYLTGRLQAAGGTGHEFSDAAVTRIWQLSQGIPRKINQLADLSLLVGYVDELEAIGPIEVTAAAEELTSISLPRAA